MEWTLITGGSHGIGKALALDCLSRGMAVAVVALPDKHLSAMSRELSADYGNKFTSFGIDLTDGDAIDRIMEWVAIKRLTVKYLVNNAGFGRGGLIENTCWSEYLSMMQLNNQIMVGLTLAVLPHLKRTKGGILNMSSMEATLPLPYKTVYTGTKAFVFNYSLALREELQYYDVGVTVLCPGPVITNEDGLKRVEAMGWQAKVLVTLPEDIAPGAIDGLLKNKDVIRPGLLVRLILAVAYVFPRGLKMRILEKIFSKYREEDKVVPESFPIPERQKVSVR